MPKIDLDGLMKKGFSMAKAQIIVGKKLTWKNLQEMSDENLKNILGGDEEAKYHINLIRTSGRPDIPSDVYYNIMYESNRTCCICKNDTRPIIIHHITPWVDARSHNPENLVVLCVLHHAEAHRGLQSGKGLIEKKLPPEEIRNHKEKWLEEVKEGNKRVASGLTRHNDNYDWIYFNHPRFFELAQRMLGKSIKDARFFEHLRSVGVIDHHGIPTTNLFNADKSYWIAGEHNVHLNMYLSSVAEAVFDKRELVNLNREWNSLDEVYNVVKGRAFVLQGRFYFKDAAGRINKGTTGEGQERIGHIGKTIKGLGIEFAHDLFYCTSSSAKGVHLSGNTEVTIFAHAREPIYEGGQLLIKPTVYAMGLWFNPVERRFTVSK